VAKYVRYLKCSRSIKIKGYPFFATGFVVVGLCFVVPDGVFCSISYSCIQFHDCFLRVSILFCYVKDVGPFFLFLFCEW
jgi:hypothetical protein